MAFQIKTRVLLGLIAVCMCIVAAPAPVPADAPTRDGNTAGAAEPQAGNASDAVPVSSEESSDLEREVVPNLPFTGLDVLTLLGVAVGLSLLAWILYRLSAPRS
jgi:hypothetical protein